MAQPEIVAMFMIHDPGSVEGAQIDNLGEAVGVVFCVVPKSKDGVTGVIVPSPVKVILVLADGFGKTIRRAQDIHGAGFTVVAAEDGGVGADVRR